MGHMADLDFKQLISEVDVALNLLHTDIATISYETGPKFEIEKDLWPGAQLVEASRYVPIEASFDWNVQ